MIILLYGGVGSGKTTISSMFSAKYDSKVYELDKIVHTLYKKNNPAYKQILRICGKKVLDSSGDIDRTKLAEILTDRNMLVRVNHAVHPIAWAKAFHLANEYIKRHKGKSVILEAALLPPLKYNSIDKYIYIHSDPEIRRKRLKNDRGYSDEKIDYLINAQPSAEEYRSFADHIIINNTKLEDIICDFSV